MAKYGLGSITHTFYFGIQRAPDIFRINTGNSTSKPTIRTAMQGRFSKEKGAMVIFMVLRFLGQFFSKLTQKSEQCKGLVKLIF